MSTVKNAGLFIAGAACAVAIYAGVKAIKNRFDADKSEDDEIIDDAVSEDATKKED